MRKLNICAAALMVFAGFSACSNSDSGGDDDSGAGGSGGTGNNGTGSTGTGTSTSTNGTSTSAGSNGTGTGATSTAGTTGTSTDGTSTTTGGTGSSTTSTSTGGASTGGTTSTTTVVACTETSGESTSAEAPPVIQFVIDNTQSMLNEVSTGVTKTAALQEAFASAITTIQAAHPTYAVGLSFFHRSSTGCTDSVEAVPIAPLTTDQATLLSTEVNNQANYQATPTQDSWQFGADTVKDWTYTDTTYDASNRYVVVLTDGVPTLGADCANTTSGDDCGGTSVQGISVAQYADFITAVGDYYTTNNVMTFMVAIPGAESLTQVTCSDGTTTIYTPVTKMGEVATAGNTELIDLTASTTTFATDLTNALTSVASNTTTVLSCSYPVPDPPVIDGVQQVIDQEQVAVWYFGSAATACSADTDCPTGEYCSLGTSTNANKCYSVIPKSTDSCATPTGWMFDSTASALTVKLCDTTCSAAQADTGAAIEIYVGCYGVG